MTKREPNARGTGDQLRAQLVEAASGLLLDTQAVALPSLRAVARACSVSPAAVYLHFDSAQALTSAVIDYQLVALDTAIRAGFDSAAAPRDQLRGFALAYVTWGLAHPGAYQLLFESADRLALPGHDLDDPNWALMDAAAAMVAADRGSAWDVARAEAFRLWAALHGIVSLRIHKPEVPWPEVDTEVPQVVERLIGL
jgi:AcrR family transcriptional regulator